MYRWSYYIFCLKFDFFRSFEFSAEFSRLSVIRYNAQVDTASQILFNSYIDDTAGLLAAYDAIPYDGSGKRWWTLTFFCQCSSFGASRPFLTYT